MDDLLDVAMQHRNALDWLRDCMDTLGRLSTDPDTGEPLPWAEANDAYGNLQVARDALVNALAPLQAAIAEAQAAQDDAEDRADAMRY